MGALITWPRMGKTHGRAQGQLVAALGAQSMRQSSLFLGEVGTHGASVLVESPFKTDSPSVALTP